MHWRGRYIKIIQQFYKSNAFRFLLNPAINFPNIPISSSLHLLNYKSIFTHIPHVSQQSPLNLPSEDTSGVASRLLKIRYANHSQQYLCKKVPFPFFLPQNQFFNQYIHDRSPNSLKFQSHSFTNNRIHVRLIRNRIPLQTHARFNGSFEGVFCIKLYIVYSIMAYLV